MTDDELFCLVEEHMKAVANKFGCELRQTQGDWGTVYYLERINQEFLPKLQFEMKFYSQEFEWSFAADKTFAEVISHIEVNYPNVDLRCNAEGFSVRSNGEHVGNIKPAYPDNSKIKWLQSLKEK